MEVGTQWLTDIQVDTEIIHICLRARVRNVCVFPSAVCWEGLEAVRPHGNEHIVFRSWFLNTVL